MTAVMYWLCERLRDLWLWPLNLVRDFPARSGRLAQTVLQGGGGVGNALGQFSQAVHQRNVRATAARTAQETVIWLHLLTAQLFDLLGGPELCQFVMHLGMRTTPLTQPEIDLARQIFGANNLRYNDIRIAEGGILNLIFRYNGRLAFATWYTIHLPASQQKGETAVSSRHNLPLLIHELTHIFQYHHVGSRYLGEAIFHLITTQRDCYQYGGPQGLQTCWQQGVTFNQFNREQQAQIIQDYFTRRNANQNVTTYLPYLEQLQQRQL